MSTPKQGQIRCPTCHESTPPGAFCTRCGQPIPSSARTRPRGLDRQELEDRLRGRRPGDAPYRRGTSAGEAAAEGGGFDRFEPEPDDALAVREPPGRAAEPPRVDNLAASSEPAAPEQPANRWPREAPRTEPEPWPEQDGADEPIPAAEPGPPYQAQATDVPPGYAPPPFGAQPYGEPDASPQPVDGGGAYYDYGTDYDYDAAAPHYADERGSGGPWLIVGIIGLGLVALLGGVLLSGLFGRGSGLALESATPTPSAQLTPSSSTPAQQSGTPAASASATAGQPGTFADGFTASVQPCATKQMTKDGCTKDGSTLSGDTVWVWSGFKNGKADDVIGVTLVDAATGDELQDATLELSRIGCKPDQVCPGGYITFSFSGIGPGDYLLRVNRNGTFAAEAPFTIQG